MTRSHLGFIALVAGAITISLLLFRANARLEEKLLELEMRPASADTSITNEVSVSFPETLSTAPNDNKAEVIALRHEVNLLRQKIAEMSGFATEVEEKEALRQRLGGHDFEIETEPGARFAAKRYYRKELWEDAGLQTPEAALQTALWAVSTTNIDRRLEAHHWPTNLTEERKSLVIARIRKNGFPLDPAAGALGVKIESISGTSDVRDYSVILDNGPNQPARQAQFSLNYANGAWRVGRIMLHGGGDDDYMVPK